MTYGGDVELEPEAQQHDEDDRRRKWIGLLVMAALVALVVWLLLQFLAFVPSTIGMTRNRAEDVIEQAGFRSTVETTLASAQLSGRVVAQSPVWGLRFTFWPIHISVGAGPGEGTTVGDLWTPTTYDADYSLALGTGGGGQLPADAEEMYPLYVPATPTERLMPNVQNMTESRARQAIRDAGMSVAVHYGPSTTGVAKGRVFYQSPTPGSRIVPREKATIWVSTGTLNIAVGGGYWYPRPTYP